MANFIINNRKIDEIIKSFPCIPTTKILKRCELVEVSFDEKRMIFVIRKKGEQKLLRSPVISLILKGRTMTLDNDLLKCKKTIFYLYGSDRRFRFFVTKKKAELFLAKKQNKVEKEEVIVQETKENETIEETVLLSTNSDIINKVAEDEITEYIAPQEEKNITTNENETENKGEDVTKIEKIKLFRTKFNEKLKSDNSSWSNYTSDKDEWVTNIEKFIFSSGRIFTEFVQIVENKNYESYLLDYIENEKHILVLFPKNCKLFLQTILELVEESKVKKRISDMIIEVENLRINN